jgi:type I restriction enzyme R subunit
MKATTEKAFEVYVEETLSKKGWISVSNEHWDKKRAIFPSLVLNFIQVTQLDLYTQMVKLHGTELDAKLIEALIKERDSKGTLYVLRHGFKFYGKTFHLAYFKPDHGLNAETLELYAKNNIGITRQIPCHPQDGSTVDIVLSMNGLPLATIELKNPVSGQTMEACGTPIQSGSRCARPALSIQERCDSILCCRSR